MNEIQDLIEKYKSTRTVPKHPKTCPECGQKVGVYHINYSEAVFLCSNGECVWPLATHGPEEILGKSDVSTLVKIKVKREQQNEILVDPYSVDDDDDIDSTEANDKTSGTVEGNGFPENEESDQNLSPSQQPSDEGIEIKSSEDVVETRLEEPQKESSVATTVRESQSEEQKSQSVPMDTNDDEVQSDPVEDKMQGIQACTESTNEESHEKEDVNSADSTEPMDESETQETASFEESMPLEVPTLLSPMTPATPATPMPPSPAVELPNLLSPMAPSPARPASTPLRDDNDEFLRPSSTFGTPRRLNATPMHLPPPISPLPATPRRGSERSINLDYDLQLTDSEWSDVESTPRHVSFRPNEGLDMPKIFASPKARPSYSKDLGKIGSNSNEAEETPPGTPMRIKIKRQSGNEWNVEKTPEPTDQDVVLPDRQSASGKLDKVVLNLKKSVTSNTWYAPQVQDVNIEQPTVQSQTTPTSVVPPKEERRGRKSKVAPPMKIQNVQALASSDTEGPKQPLPCMPEVPKVVEVQSITKQSDIANKEVQGEVQESQAISATQSKTIPAPKSPVKTFVRKKSKPLATKSILPKPVKVAKVANDGTNWAEIAELSSQAANAFKQDDGFNEFCQLMKAATGDKQVDLNFIQKVQKQLSISTTSNSRSQVTFHVSQNKANIDLPTEESSMSVSDSSSAVQVMLSAESDGIVGDVLKNKEPIPYVVQDHKKRGRPSKPKTSSPPPTMVPPPMSAVSRQFIPRPAENSGMDDLLRNPQAINNFMSSLQELMKHYQLPMEWSQYSNVDPYVAMMVTRSQDEAYREINFDAMLHFYAQIRNQQHYQQQFGYGQVMGPPLQAPSSSSIDLRPANERSYAELQTVRGSSQVTDATQVLRQHQQESNEPEVVETVEPEPAAHSVRFSLILLRLHFLQKNRTHFMIEF